MVERESHSLANCGGSNESFVRQGEHQVPRVLIDPLVARDENFI